MKKIAYICMALLGVACNKLPLESTQDADEVMLILDDRDLSLDVTTKATAITSLPTTLWWCASTGTSGASESQKYAPSSGTVSSGKIATGKYQTATPTSYNWYVSNAQMANAATGAVISVTGNGTDIVAGTAKGNNTAAPAVALDHIFARTGSLTFNTQTGYDVSNVSWKISKATSGTAGTYNIAKGEWTPGSAAMAATDLTSTSDLYLVPGVYTVSVTYTLTKDHYSETFTRSGTTTLEKGKVNSITATATGGNAMNITVSTTLSGWNAGPGKEVVM